MTPLVLPFTGASSPDVRAEILRFLHRGALIAYPTDTIYGLGGDFFSSSLHQRIDRLKGRAEAPYSCAVADMEMLQSLAAGIPELFSRELARLLPGPYTFVFSASPRIDRMLLRGRETVGIRIPNLPPLLSVIRAGTIPWLTTSVNRSGEPPLSDPAQIARQFPEIDLLLDAGPLEHSPASTVLDLSAQSPRIVRHGAGWERIDGILARWSAHS